LIEKNYFQINHLSSLSSKVACPAQLTRTNPPFRHPSKRLKESVEMAEAPPAPKFELKMLGKSR
jgi:hypothetical protein